MRRPTWLVLTVVAVAACGGSHARSGAAGGNDTLNERQRDSVLAKSRIPGASRVGKAMRVADSTSAGVRASDTIGGTRGDSTP